MFHLWETVQTTHMNLKNIRYFQYWHIQTHQRTQAAGEVKLTNPTADKHNSPFLRIYRLTAVTGSIYKCGFSPQKEGL